MNATGLSHRLDRAVCHARRTLAVPVWAFGFLGATGCGDGADKAAGATSEVIDATLSYPATDAEIVLEPPPVEIPAYTDMMSCWFSTWNGPDVGVTSGAFRQSPKYGHHVIVMRTNADADEFPDGTVRDCTASDALDMTQMDPFVLPDDPVEKGLSYLDLPDGMANKLKAGDRFLVQSHWVNYEDKPVRVNDRIELDTIPIDQVETFAAPLVHTSTTFELPEGPSDVVVNCTFEEDVSLLYLLGHMHENGTAITVDYHKADGTTERIYEVEGWTVGFRDLPPVTYYDDPFFSVKAGESFTTTCSFDNRAGHPLGFPDEMCVATAIAFPLTVPAICDEQG